MAPVVARSAITSAHGEPSAPKTNRADLHIEGRDAPLFGIERDALDRSRKRETIAPLVKEARGRRARASKHDMPGVPRHVLRRARRSIVADESRGLRFAHGLVTHHRLFD